MSGMTLHAQEGLSRRQQLIVRGPVRVVAIGTVFGHIGMLIDERSLILHVATGAHRLDRLLFKEPFLGGTVRFVAIDTGHLLLWNRVMRKLGKLHPDALMAVITEFGHLLPTNLLLRPLMKLVAVEATDIAVGMGARVPVMEVRSGRSRMALEADQRLGLCGDFVEIQKCLEPAAILPFRRFSQLGDCKTAGPVTGLAVHQGQSGFG